MFPIVEVSLQKKLCWGWVQRCTVLLSSRSSPLFYLCFILTAMFQ